MIKDEHMRRLTVFALTVLIFAGIAGRDCLAQKEQSVKEENSAHRGPWGRPGVDRYIRHMLMALARHPEKFGLSADQESSVKKLEANAWKELASRDAAINALKVQINTLMWESPMDFDQVSLLISRQHDLEEERSKYLVSVFNKLKDILTEEQIEELKRK